KKSSRRSRPGAAARAGTAPAGIPAALRSRTASELIPTIVVRASCPWRVARKITPADPVSAPGFANLIPHHAGFMALLYHKLRSTRCDGGHSGVKSAGIRVNGVLNPLFIIVSGNEPDSAAAGGDDDWLSTQTVAALCDLPEVSPTAAAGAGVRLENGALLSSLPPAASCGDVSRVTRD